MMTEVQATIAVLWIEETVFCGGLSLPMIKVHSTNISARKKIELNIGHIYKMAEHYKK